VQPAHGQPDRPHRLPRPDARLQQRGAQKGFRVVVAKADTFDAAWRFLDQLTGDGR
jgi:hypothetical protein